MFPFYLCRKHHLHVLGWEQNIPGTRPTKQSAECLLCRRASAEVEGTFSQLLWPLLSSCFTFCIWRSVIMASVLSPAPPFLQSVINTDTFRRAAFTAALSATLPNCTCQGFNPMIPHDLGPGAAHLGLTSHHSTVRSTGPRVRLWVLRPVVSGLWMRPGVAPAPREHVETTASPLGPPLPASPTGSSQWASVPRTPTSRLTPSHGDAGAPRAPGAQHAAGELMPGSPCPARDGSALSLAPGGRFWNTFPTDPQKVLWDFSPRPQRWSRVSTACVPASSTQLPSLVPLGCSLGPLPK